MRKYLCLFLVLAAVLAGFSAADTVKDFRSTNVSFTPVDTRGTEDSADDVLLPAVLGDPLPDTDSDGVSEVQYVVKKNGKVASTNPGQIYGVITINNTTATNFAIADSFGSQFNINPARLAKLGKIGGGVEIIRVDADGYATVLTKTPQVVSAAVDNDANTVGLEIALDTPLDTGENLMIYLKYKTALKGMLPDESDFVNEVTVLSDGNEEFANASIEFSTK